MVVADASLQEAWDRPQRSSSGQDGRGARQRDVDPGHPFFAAIQWMGQTGLAKGTPQPSGPPRFAPGEAISRQAVAAFLHRTALLLGP